MAITIAVTETNEDGRFRALCRIDEIAAQARRKEWDTKRHITELDNTRRGNPNSGWQAAMRYEINRIKLEGK